MFNIKVKYGDTDINISFPCTNNELYAKFAELHVPDEKKSQVQVFVADIDYPELEGLKDNFYDTDELNHLAQRLNSLDANELKKFDAVAALNKTNSIRELINLTYNMHYYTLIRDMSNLAEIGRIHILTREGGISVNEAKEMDFEKIGRKLIESGTGKLTKYGLLFTNDDLS